MECTSYLVITNNNTNISPYILVSNATSSFIWHLSPIIFSYHWPAGMGSGSSFENLG